MYVLRTYMPEVPPGSLQNAWRKRSNKSKSHPPPCPLPPSPLSPHATLSNSTPLPKRLACRQSFFRFSHAHTLECLLFLTSTYLSHTLCPNCLAVSLSFCPSLPPSLPALVHCPIAPLLHIPASGLAWLFILYVCTNGKYVHSCYAAETTNKTFPDTLPSAIPTYLSWLALLTASVSMHCTSPRAFHPLVQC